MASTNPILSALRIPYLAVRLPMGVVDEQVVVRWLGEDSSAHRVLTQRLQQLDALAATVFAADQRSDAPGPAVDDSATIDTATTAKDTTPVADTTPAEPEVIDAEEQQEIEQLTDAFLADDDLAPRAGELAEDDEIRRVQAEIRAKQAVEDERGQL